MKIGCKIENVVGVNFKKLLAKIVNLIFKYILSSYFVECDWRCSNNVFNLVSSWHVMSTCMLTTCKLELGT